VSVVYNLLKRLILTCYLNKLFAFVESGQSSRGKRARARRRRRMRRRRSHNANSLFVFSSNGNEGAKSRAVQLERSTPGVLKLFSSDPIGKGHFQMLIGNSYQMSFHLIHFWIKIHGLRTPDLRTNNRILNNMPSKFSLLSFSLMFYIYK